MRKIKTLIAVAALSIAASCMASADNMKVKTAMIHRTWAISPEAKEFVGEDVVPEIKATIDMPTDNDPLSQAVRKWISSRLGFNGEAYTDASKLINDYISDILSGNEKSNDFSDDMSIRKIFENDKLVTYEMSGYEFPFGAAHGMPYCHGVTFSKETAQEVGNQLVKENANINKLLVKGLIKNLDLRGEDELEEVLFNGNLKELERPSNNPWVNKDGIVFQYSAYEIAPFAAGMPAAVITVDDATPHLTPLGKKLLK